jgi:hypothetical protein
MRQSCGDLRHTIRNELDKKKIINKKMKKEDSWMNSNTNVG